jgi:5'-nucleotidase
MLAMRILVTNDDGILAPGLLALSQALRPLGEVFVIAPERPRSAVGHAVTLHKPLRLDEVTLADGTRGWAATGTPSDCVSLGLDVLMDGRADLVFSGINDGANLGWDLTYSGTVAAAMEGIILGIPSIAISVATDDKPADFRAAADFAPRIACALRERGIEPGALLNVNVPNLPPERIAGVEVTHQGCTQYDDRIDARKDPRGRPYYWFIGTLRDMPQEPGSDVDAVSRGAISVTPVHLDLTAKHLLPCLREWKL